MIQFPACGQEIFLFSKVSRLASPSPMFSAYCGYIKWLEFEFEYTPPCNARDRKTVVFLYNPIFVLYTGSTLLVTTLLHLSQLLVGCLLKTDWWSIFCSVLNKAVYYFKIFCTGYNEIQDLNPMHCLYATFKYILKHCIIYMHPAAFTALFLSFQGHEQVEGRCVWHPHK
jgi:hypothetical protein